MFGNRRQSEDHIADLLLESLRVDHAYVYTHIRIYTYIYIHVYIIYRCTYTYSQRCWVKETAKPEVFVKF